MKSLEMLEKELDNLDFDGAANSREFLIKIAEILIEILREVRILKED